jgi:hypothetical protein
MVMFATWVSKRCVLCGGMPDRLSKAHVIPVSLAGRLTADCLCRSCNSSLGTRFEAGLTEDPPIRLAIEALNDRTPALARLRQGRHFIAERDDVIVKMRMQEDRLAVIDSPQADGSLVKSRSRALADIETILRRRGADQDELRGARERVEAAPVGIRTQGAPGLAVKHGRTNTASPDLRRSFAAEESFLAIAFLYLALNIGSAIYSPGFESIRRTLLGHRKRGWSVTPMFAGRSYEPFHGLALESWRFGLTVQIRLFGCLAWLVTFDELALPEGFVPTWYRLDLDSGEEFFAPGRSPAA